MQEALVLRLSAMTAVTGHESAAAESVLAILPGSGRDPAGNVIRTRGKGLPLRVAACFLDEPGHVVGGITPEGYVTLRRAGSPPEGPAPERFLFGQRVRIYGAAGPIEGVVGVRSIHLQRGRSDLPPPPDGKPGDLLDDVFVDFGAADAAQARSLGVRLLAPVAAERQVQRYGDDLVSARTVSGRAACAALLEATLGSDPPRAGSSIAVFAVRRYLGWAGPASVITQAIQVVGQDVGTGLRIVFLGEPGRADSLGTGRILEEEIAAQGEARVAIPDGTRAWRLPTRYAGTPVETISLRDVEALADRLRSFLSGEP